VLRHEIGLEIGNFAFIIRGLSALIVSQYCLTLLVNDKIINLKSARITYLCLGPSIISLLMRLSSAFLASALVLINWELSHNAGSCVQKVN